MEGRHETKKKKTVQRKQQQQQINRRRRRDAVRQAANGTAPRRSVDAAAGRFIAVLPRRFTEFYRVSPSLTGFLPGFTWFYRFFTSLT